MKNKTPLKHFPIPSLYNTPSNGLSAIVEADTDLGLCVCRLFEHEGIFWYCLKRDDISCNSVGFVSLRSCVSSLKTTLRFFGFTLRDPKSLDAYVHDWENG